MLLLKHKARYLSGFNFFPKCREKNIKLIDDYLDQRGLQSVFKKAGTA